MNSAVSESTPHCGETNEPVELARYAIAAGERVIYGQRIRGVVRLVDVPAEGRGRRFVIERELISMGELRSEGHELRSEGHELRSEGHEFEGRQVSGGRSAGSSQMSS